MAVFIEQVQTDVRRIEGVDRRCGDDRKVVRLFHHIHGSIGTLQRKKAALLLGTIKT